MNLLYVYPCPQLHGDTEVKDLNTDNGVDLLAKLTGFCLYITD